MGLAEEEVSAARTADEWLALLNRAEGAVGQTARGNFIHLAQNLSEQDLNRLLLILSHDELTTLLNDPHMIEALETVVGAPTWASTLRYVRRDQELTEIVGALYEDLPSDVSHELGGQFYSEWDDLNDLDFSGVGRPVYDPYGKHIPGDATYTGRRGTPIDIDEAEGQYLLDGAVQVGDRLYNVHEGRIIVFARSNTYNEYGNPIYHAYTAPGVDVAGYTGNPIRAMQDSGIITAAEARRLRSQSE